MRRIIEDTSYKVKYLLLFNFLQFLAVVMVFNFINAETINIKMSNFIGVLIFIFLNIIQIFILTRREAK